MSLGCRWQTVSRLCKVEIFCRRNVAEMSLTDRFSSVQNREILSLGCRWNVAGAARQFKIPDLRHLVIPLDHETKIPV